MGDFAGLLRRSDINESSGRAPRAQDLSHFPSTKFVHENNDISSRAAAGSNNINRGGGSPHSHVRSGGFPTVLGQASGRRIKNVEILEDEFREFVRPALEPKLSKFCTDLTGISQKEVNRQGVSFLEAHDRWIQFIAKYPNHCICTCGDWDLLQMLPRQWCYFGKSIMHSVYKKDAGTYPGSAWCNLKVVFRQSEAGALRLRQLGLTSPSKVLGAPTVSNCNGHLPVQMTKEGFKAITKATTDSSACGINHNANKSLGTDVENLNTVTVLSPAQSLFKKSADSTATCCNSMGDTQKLSKGNATGTGLTADTALAAPQFKSNKGALTESEPYQNAFGSKLSAEYKYDGELGGKYSTHQLGGPIDLVEMLEGVGLPLVGHHHSGIDDCRNLARLTKRMVESFGAEIKITAMIDGLKKKRNSGVKLNILQPYLNVT